jgi:hypothetical protein
MLNQLCILSRNWEQLIEESSHLKEALLVFLVDAERHAVSELFQMLNTPAFLRNTMLRFSVCIDVDSAEPTGDNTVLQQCNAYIPNLVFHPSFYVEAGIPLLFYITTGTQEETGPCRTLLAEVMKGQGYASVKWIGTREDQSRLLKDSVTMHRHAEPRQLYETYYNHFLKKVYFNRHVLVHDPSAKCRQWEAQLQQAEDDFSREHPLLFQQMQLLADTLKANAVLKWKEERYKAEVENYKTYLQLIHSQDEASKINAFYRNEYEVLPLWYKQLGHVIKVVIGKRTFTSLYNRNVKKYKS